MALVRLTRTCLSLLYRKSSCDVNKLPVQKLQRNFSLGEVRMDKTNKSMDQIPVDGLSKIALVVDGKYKTLKDVPAFLPYGKIFKARDKFRIKASIASGIFITFLMIYLIRKNRRAQKVQQYEGMRDAEAAMHKK